MKGKWGLDNVVSPSLLDPAQLMGTLEIRDVTATSAVFDWTIFGFDGIASRGVSCVGRYSLGTDRVTTQSAAFEGTWPFDQTELKKALAVLCGVEPTGWPAPIGDRPTRVQFELTYPYDIEVLGDATQLAPMKMARFDGNGTMTWSHDSP